MGRTMTNHVENFESHSYTNFDVICLARMFIRTNLRFRGQAVHFYFRLFAIFSLTLDLSTNFRFSTNLPARMKILYTQHTKFNAHITQFTRNTVSLSNPNGKHASTQLQHSIFVRIFPCASEMTEPFTNTQTHTRKSLSRPSSTTSIEYILIANISTII